MLKCVQMHDTSHRINDPTKHQCYAQFHMIVATEKCNKIKSIIHLTHDKSWLNSNWLFIHVMRICTSFVVENESFRLDNRIIQCE